MAAKHSQQYCGCFAVLLFLSWHVKQVATHQNGLPPSDTSIVDGSDRQSLDIKTVAILRACHLGGCPKCPDGAGWGLDGKDWGCCGSYKGCCHLASALCYVHDALCRCCQLGLFFCGPFCNPDQDCESNRHKMDVHFTSATQKHHFHLKAVSSDAEFKRANNVTQLQNKNLRSQSEDTRSHAVVTNIAHEQVSSNSFDEDKFDLMISGSHGPVSLKTPVITDTQGNQEDGSGEYG